MASSTAAVESRLNGDEEEDEEESEYEYEEIEVEEEISEEIEVEVDEGDDESVGEPTTSPCEETQQNDNISIKDPEQHEVHKNSESSVPKEKITNPPDDPQVSASTEPINQAKSSSGETVSVVKDNASIDRLKNTEITKLSDRGTVSTVGANVSFEGLKNAEIKNVSAREIVFEVGANTSFDEVQNTPNLKRSVEEMGSSIGVQASIENDIAAEEAIDISKRSDPTTHIYQRSVALNNMNKRAAIICDFFAKGWCIKGKSCRFLHIREDKVSEQNIEVSKAKGKLKSDDNHFGRISYLDSSQIPDSESGFHSRISFSGEAQRPVEITNKVSFEKWVPSEPFRPSYPITQQLLSKTNIFNPVCDSIGQTNSGEVFSKSSLFTSKENKTEKTELEGVKTEQSRNSLPKEEKSSNSPNIEDFNEVDKTEDIDSGSAIEKAISKDKTEPKKVRVRQNDGNIKESKAMNIFHNALVEKVKELLRPKWHEGVLTRDAHKLIVKKTVDKVVRTLQPNQIPSTSELVEQYLTVSQNKLANLVVAYVEKYGKS